MATPTRREFLALGDYKHARRAAELLLQTTEAPTYAFSIIIGGLAWEAAHACGLSRTLIKKLRGRKEHEGRGDDDERIDTEGALAEILLAHVLDKAPDVSIAPLVGHKPDSGGVDITLQGHRLDVKSVGQTKTYININEWQHVGKAAAVYVLCHFASPEVADVYVVSAASVAEPTWKLNKFLHGKPLDPRRYYFSTRLPKDQMEPLPVEV